MDGCVSDVALNETVRNYQMLQKVKDNTILEQNRAKLSKKILTCPNEHISALKTGDYLD